MNKTTINVNQSGFTVFSMIADKDLLMKLFHRAFRENPEFKDACTEALLTFDTEAGGETMNLEAEESGKEEQP